MLYNVALMFALQASQQDCALQCAEGNPRWCRRQEGLQQLLSEAHATNCSQSGQLVRFMMQPVLGCQYAAIVTMA